MGVAHPLPEPRGELFAGRLESERHLQRLLRIRVHRNQFRGPGFASLDAGLFKKFVIHERLSATLRFEAFNALNHPNLTVPSASVTGSNFLKITSAYDPRILQLALRLAW